MVSVVHDQLHCQIAQHKAALVASEEDVLKDLAKGIWLLRRGSGTSCHKPWGRFQDGQNQKVEESEGHAPQQATEAEEAR